MYKDADGGEACLRNVYICFNHPVENIKESTSSLFESVCFM